MKGAADFEDGAELFEVGSGAAGVADDWFGDEALKLGVGSGEEDFVAVGDAEFDTVLAFEGLTGIHSYAVNPDAVAAAEIFENVFAGFQYDLGVVARDAAIAQNEVVIRGAADAEGEGVK